jgi:ABC-type sugar transport system ATPase subunit
MLAEDEMGTSPDHSPSGVPVLTFRELTKTFGQTVAVDHVSFDVRSGEIHALVGENGAGKSTLIRMLAGDYSPDSGEVLLAGQPVRFAHPSEALEHGIGFVHQVPMFVPNLSITENLLLGVPFTRRHAGLIDWQAEHQAARADLAAVGLSLNPRADLETLSAHERQLVAVARALKRGLKVLVLDEVTASLSEPEVRILHSHIRSLRDHGVSIIYVSHRLEEIFRIADRVTVLRDGKAVATLDVEGLTQKKLARHIVGYEMGDLFERRAVAADLSKMPRLVVEGLSDERLRNVTFSVSRGEVLGVCGLGGSGRTRLLHMIFGLIPHTSGTIMIDGQLRDFRDPAEALAAGVTMVTEDRIEDGFVQTLPVWQNVTLPWAPLFRRWGFLQLGEEKRAAARNTGRLGVRMPSIEADMNELSGGNQQKAIFARWITGPLKILLLDEPTHGVDIRSKRQIYDIIRELAAEGVSLLLVSSELEEIEALCQRAILLHRGEMIDELQRADISKDRILHRLLAGGAETGNDRHAHA